MDAMEVGVGKVVDSEVGLEVDLGEVDLVVDLGVVDLVVDLVVVGLEEETEVDSEEVMGVETAADFLVEWMVVVGKAVDSEEEEKEVGLAVVDLEEVWEVGTEEVVL